MNTPNALGALRVAAAGGRALVQTPPADALTRALDVTSRVMASANDRMATALADHDLAGYERASLSYDAAERRFDELWAAASDAGCVQMATLPDKPAKLGRFTRRERLVRRLAARLRLRPASAH